MPREYSSFVELENEIMFVLMMHQGQDNPIGRWSLVRRIYGEDAVTEETMNDGNPYDRAVRNAIQRLRKAGKHICSKPNGKGYYYAKTREEYKEFKTSYLGSNYEKFLIVSAMDESADERFGPEPKPTPTGQAVMFG